MPYYGWPLATVEEMGEAFFRDAEFRALQLVRFLKTPTGEFLEQAVELAVPRALAPEFALIVGALKFAAARQHGETIGKAALAVLSAIVIGVIIKEVGKAA